MFCPVAYIHAQAFTARFAPSMQLYHPRHKTACRALQVLFLRFAPFYRRRYQTDTSGYNAACATLDSIPATGRLAPIPDTSATPDAVQASIATDHASPAGSASPPVQGQPGGGFDASHARRLAIWYCVSGQGAPGQPSTLHQAEQSSGRDAAGGAEPLAALAAVLFRAFAR